MMIQEAGELFGLITKEDAPIPLTGISVSGTITGRAARVTLKQRFENREAKAIEAVYKFPLPESSSVCGFTVATGDRTLRGRVEEREKAFVEYDEALAQGHGAYLLDEERPNIFTLSVGNVKPHHVVEIAVDYVTMLDTHQGEVRFVLPTTISPRYVPADMPLDDGIPVEKLVNPEFRLDVPYGVTLHLDILGRGNIAGIECPSHAIRTSYKDDMVAVEFSSEAVAMDHDFVLTITYSKAFESRGYISSDGEHTYVQVDFAPQGGGATDPGQVARLQPPPQPEVVFLLDCSGSMRGPSIAQAKKSLEVFLRGMSPGSLFNVYRFGSTFSSLYPKSVEYNEKNLAAALHHLEGVDADLGGTEMLAPLHDIYGIRPPLNMVRNIVLLTDGQVGNEADILALAQGEPSTRVFTVGIGFGSNEYLTRNLAALTGAATEAVAPGERIEPKVMRLFGKVMGSGVEELTVDWGLPAVQAPLKLVAYAGECITLFARMAGVVAIPEVMQLRGRVNGQHRQWEVTVNGADGAVVALPLLWARARISDLEEGVAGSGGSRQKARRGRSIGSEVVALSKQYGLLSRATSFITVEYRSDADKSTGEIELRKVPSMLTRGWGGIIDTGVAYMGAPQACMLMERFDYMSSMAEANCVQCASFGMAAPSPAADLDPLADILSLQSAGGGFKLAGKRQAGAVGLDLAELREAAGKMQGGGAEPLKLLCTAVVIALLESRFPDRRDEWFAVTEKSRLWLRAQVERLSPSVDGTPLEQWARDYVEANVRG